ncbi:MAG: helix-turn-helix transcriptional regulator [Spirochaetaceae bacterium]|nr:helix-turn-helix transcriptional regulator [Spirochaetaceae bacterium]
MAFKENLQEELSYQGLMVKELAARAGLQASSISNYLKKNSSIPSADIAVKIAKALNVSVEYLVTGAEPLCCSSDARRLAEKIARLSPRDQKCVAALVNTMNASCDKIAPR